jgi:hypothetical protein
MSNLDDGNILDAAGNELIHKMVAVLERCAVI